MPFAHFVKVIAVSVVLSSGVFVAGCSEDDAAPPATNAAVGLDPETAPVASVDRFSDSFGKLFKRSGPAFDPSNVSKAVPAANAPIDMDKFLVHSFGPSGEKVTYYSLDIVPTLPSATPGYVFVNEDGSAVAGQLGVVDSLPGDAGYNDFLALTQVKVKAGYVANSITSAAQVTDAAAAGSVTLVPTGKIANWSFVPKGTTASRKFQGKTITGFRAWMRGQVAHYLQFETDLVATSAGGVPAAQIVVFFKNNMSPAMGFAAEADGVQTHNAVNTLPGQSGYSSLWAHSVGDATKFDTVSDFGTASAAIMAVAPDVNVNCPVVE